VFIVTRQASASIGQDGRVESTGSDGARLAGCADFLCGRCSNRLGVQGPPQHPHACTVVAPGRPRQDGGSHGIGCDRRAGPASSSPRAEPGFARGRCPLRCSRRGPVPALAGPEHTRGIPCASISSGDGSPSPCGPGCGDTNSWGYWLAYGTWQRTYGADYTGPDAYQDPYDARAGCNGRSFNTLTTTTQTGTFWWGFHIQAQTTQTCQIYASVPGDHAGDYDTRYDFWAQDGSGNWSWLGWPGQTINQEPLSGFIQIGIDLTVPAGTQYLIVSLSNASATPDRWAGAGAMAFSCR